jgi:membrane protein implicated in regulation of membrane protease activity
MPKLIKVVLFGLLFLGFFMLWMASIQLGFGINNIARFTAGEDEVAWGVPLLILLLSPLLFRPFSRALDRWDARMKEANHNRSEQEKNGH